MGIQKDVFKFNVGGRIFQTTATTLANAGRDSFFGALFDDNWDLRQHQPDSSQQEFFVDRNPDCFAVLLDLLRTGDLYIPPNVPERLLYREAMFYGLTDHVRSAKWGPFDGNRLKLSRSVIGRAPGDGTAIRASPDGGCCVAHGSMVHVFDWMLEEHPPINLDYQSQRHRLVNAENVLISACERLGKGDGGIGLFSSSTGDLRHKFNVVHDNQIKSYTAGALSFSPDIRFFLAVKEEAMNMGLEFGTKLPVNKSISFTRVPADNCYISLLDFREKRMAWSWSDIGAPLTVDEKRVRDAIALEECNSICVVNEYDDLGFIDLRINGGSVRWSSRSRLLKGKMLDEPCYPKLALHNGQLFSSMNDCISVFCGPDWVLTSRLRRSYGGSICDFSIGGDRLFALHSEENVFDAWETPPPPVI
ncbi:BTB/POZ domain-containing protein [Hibiscus syriacus]|uniref:BTB/POZ domain-containing protein n=1 Tax=Hibiscus syriacus TaxID=106335 RepID=A0A6A3A7T3_HIBSY|nr:BTB/POZ domain-containing protein [Hibiscus syriacus]